jgi:hypothetical protein
MPRKIQNPKQKINKKQPLIQENELEKIEELQEELQELHDDVIEDKKWSSIFKWLIAILIIILVGLSAGFGFYTFKTGKNITNFKDQVQTTQEELADKDKLLEEQNKKLSLTNQENQELKDKSAKQAAQEAEATLKVEQEKQKNAKRFATSDKKETNLPGLNVRKDPCGDISGGLRVWGTSGEVLEGPVKPGPCLSGDYEWYKIKWNDGQTGWSIADYLTFNSERQISTTGYITGYLPTGYNYETQKPILSSVCATNLADNITNCNAEVNTNNYNYKLLVTAGDYVITGTFRYQDYSTKQLKESAMIFSSFTQCGYKQECKEGWNTKAKVTVSPGGVVTDANVGVPYDPNQNYYNPF